MLSSHQEIVAQATAFLQSISTADYNAVIRPKVDGSIGKHMRHVLDHYRALILGYPAGSIDYDVRTRGGQEEKDPKAALDEWQRVAHWLERLEASSLSTPVNVSTEISTQQTRIATVESTLGRELVFVVSHAVHHFSLIAMVCTHKSITMPEHFGVAPATLTHFRKQA